MPIRRLYLSEGQGEIQRGEQGERCSIFPERPFALPQRWKRRANRQGCVPKICSFRASRADWIMEISSSIFLLSCCPLASPESIASIQPGSSPTHARGRGQKRGRTTVHTCAPVWSRQDASQAIIHHPGSRKRDSVSQAEQRELRQPCALLLSHRRRF